MDTTSEELLAVWLRLSNSINNQRLVTGLSFHQAQVCGLLVRAQEEGRSLTAKELCRRTRILKYAYRLKSAGHKMKRQRERAWEKAG